jgi:8-oxo-dGTP pyrophosphatase MutT (NUDIX family)
MARPKSRSRPAEAAQPKIERRHETSAGGLIWRREPDGSIKVVLVRPAGRSTWVIPKGHLEKGETVVEAAIREAIEETGLKVGAVDPLGEISYVYSTREKADGPLTRIFKRVHFFLMQCTGGDPSAHDSEIDEVAWMSFDEALARATYPSERALIVKAREILGG